MGKATGGLVQQQFGKMAAEVLNSSSVPQLNFCAKLNIFASISATTPIPETLPASVKQRSC
ncbi:hypothetical protein ACF3N7_05645 [Cruoricaptor ignavus]|uniref:hypothetical protein n=1 Tax=Cruoricaptor ignavus TaxID=1118202 RepID=UPI00370D8EF9